MEAALGGKETSPCLLPDSGEQLSGAGELVCLNKGSSLRDEAIYFPLDSAVSLTMVRGQARIPVGIARRGDVVGVHQVLLPSFPVLDAVVLRSGNAVRLGLGSLSRALARDRSLYDRLLQYAYRTSADFLSEAGASLALSLEKRVARWLASCCDALGSEALSVTHHDLAEFLGVRRSGVTVAMHVLEGDHVIRSSRGKVQILDRQALSRFGGAFIPRRAQAS
ncbi:MULTISPECIES: Crp/Fnr family transcriptional regulator [unclassified Bosea (in: a-proteobacteria)]|uniref:Crp/Fnr family transcriptional regulator n=1 Tax=unclassified Bosea (in: a-proteobacteria) TaxID=2653178 RepID=UPI0013E00A12|nr:MULTISPECIES: Crp/Fnr family transcriptional regulator [unclassified Bosea (in: a-proteobacteria)]